MRAFNLEEWSGTDRWTWVNDTLMMAIPTERQWRTVKKKGPWDGSQEPWILVITPWPRAKQSASLGCRPVNDTHSPSREAVFFDHLWLAAGFAWAFGMTGKPSEFPPYCFSETRNSFTKPESQPKCDSQRRSVGSRLGMCERHLQMTGNYSPSICGSHRDSSPSLTLYFENWWGLWW